MKTYGRILPLDAPIPAERQAAKRHYGVHPYFTRRPFNVVRKYILHYSREGDRVLDPFGGSGVTAIEAFLENRVGIQNDINPLANFIAKGIAELAKGNLGDYHKALDIIRDRCESRVMSLESMDDAAVAKLLKKLPLPANAPLPSTADVQHYHDLFSPRQLAALAIIREAIDQLANRYARNAIRLAWSATLTKVNRTFLSAEGRAESRGGSSIFSIYRYKVAAKPIELPPWPTFYERAKNVLEAKVEVDHIIAYRKTTGGFVGRFEVYDDDIDDLPKRIEPVDYIFTDPPYGGHISYIDLSTLWNVWNGRLPTLSERKRELIVGGDLNLSEELYVKRLRDCIATCFALLKPGRWLSVVFQHWSTAYFDAILTGAAASGGDLRAAISQIGDPVWSMHKKKGNQSVLAGEMILTFLKTGKRRTIEASKPFDVEEAVSRVLRSTPNGAIYGEYLFNRIIINAWQAGALGSLHVSRTAFAGLMEDQGWSYDETAHQWRQHGTVRSLLVGL
ncbi:MAG: DNA methyltransferase [Vicinamibacterales bacterium]|nr:DNA methyltransferase [Vicinamibacterales bacterium]